MAAPPGRRRGGGRRRRAAAASAAGRRSRSSACRAALAAETAARKAAEAAAAARYAALEASVARARALARVEGVQQPARGAARALPDRRRALRRARCASGARACRRRRRRTARRAETLRMARPAVRRRRRRGRRRRSVRSRVASTAAAEARCVCFDDDDAVRAVPSGDEEDRRGTWAADGARARGGRAPTARDDDDNDDENDGSPRSFAAVVAGGSGAAREDAVAAINGAATSAAVVRAGERFRGIVTKRVERLGAFVALPGVAKGRPPPAMGSPLVGARCRAPPCLPRRERRGCRGRRRTGPNQPRKDAGSRWGAPAYGAEDVRRHAVHERRSSPPACLAPPGMRRRSGFPACRTSPRCRCTKRATWRRPQGRPR